MTEDTSPENLRKFLESDDPALIMMGLSMAKGSGFSENLLPIVLNLYMWNDDKNIRGSAKSVFNKYSPLDIQNEVNKLWKPNYRTLSKNKDKLINIIGKLLKSHEYIARASIYPILRYHDEDDEYHNLLRKLSQSPERKHLLQLLTKTFYEKSEEIRFQTVSAMHKIREQHGLGKTVEYIVKALDDNSEKIRVKASWALGDRYSSNKMKNINPLLKALKDENIKVRENIILAIGVFGEKSDAKHLLEFLEHKNKKIRNNAVKALETIQNNIAVESLINLLKKLYEESEHKITDPDRIVPYHWGYNNPLSQVCRAIKSTVKGKNIDQLVNLLKPPLHNFEDVDSDSISLTNEILNILNTIGDKKALIEFTKIVEKTKNNPKIVWDFVQPYSYGLYHKFCCFSDERALALVTVIKIAPREYQERAYNELDIRYDLKEFLRENKMKTSGNKKALIERIKTLI